MQAAADPDILQLAVQAPATHAAPPGPAAASASAVVAVTSVPAAEARGTKRSKLTAQGTEGVERAGPQQPFLKKQRAQAGSSGRSGRSGSGSGKWDGESATFQGMPVCSEPGRQGKTAYYVEKHCGKCGGIVKHGLVAGKAPRCRPCSALGSKKSKAAKA